MKHLYPTSIRHIDPMRSTILIIAALLTAGAHTLHAQDSSASADTALLPACAEGGISRIAVTIPPGQTREQVVQALQQSGGLAPGTLVRILEDHEKPRIVNPERFSQLVEMHVHRFFRAGLKVDGDAVALVQVDADGRVTAAHPETGNRDVDRSIRELWRRTRFEPVVVGSCRVPAYLHLSLRITSDFDEHWRQTEVRVQP